MDEPAPPRRGPFDRVTPSIPLPSGSSSSPPLRRPFDLTTQLCLERLQGRGRRAGLCRGEIAPLVLAEVDEQGDRPKGGEMGIAHAVRAALASPRAGWREPRLARASSPLDHEAFLRQV